LAAWAGQGGIDAHGARHKLPVWLDGAAGSPRCLPQSHPPCCPLLLPPPAATAAAGEAASEGGAAAIPPEDIAAEVQAAVEAVRGARPVGSAISLDAVRRLRQLLSNYDEPPFREAVQGEVGWCACG
jgi:hypothetical protein